ncbi:MAG TPA: nuclear transport factor 2 family protein [Kofleriaceae bacterium]|nr:nuclear transport factor 2 family protein [Kofleriaceae bacterium]
MSQAETKEIVGRYLQALRNRDLPTFMAVVAEDAEYWIAGDHPVAGTWRGHGKILQGFVMPMSTLFDPKAPYSVEVTNMIAEDDRAMVECTTSSTTAKGSPYRIAICAVFDIAGGKITRMREYFDTKYFEQTLFGAAPARPASSAPA